ncbi:TPA: tail fiber domain-containing protein [Escherichia coli]|nr:tail fiber domain-containing protein [Escherichia coli]
MADLSRIQFKRTSTKGRKPDASAMNPGELAINLADQYLLTKNDSGTIINLSCPPVYDRDVTMAGKVKGNNYILSKTANYLEDQTARDLNYFGAFRTNGLDGLLELTLNVPHSSGVQHGRGFTFQYGHTGSRVETYGYNREGQKAFSYKMYHEGDKPTPGELNVYSKQEIDRMFVKNVKMVVPSGGATRGYFKIASAIIPQSGRMAFLRIYGGNGYNVNSYDQVDFLEIVIRSGNNNPKGVSIAAYRRNSLNVHEVFAINTSGDNYDIYVNYGRYTDNVIVEFGKTVDVALTVHDVPEFSATKPATGTKFDARVITMFNTENKAGTLMFDNNNQLTYDIVSLSNGPDDVRNYLRKFRSKAGEMIWHETVQGAVYRLATGTTDSTEVLRVDSNSAIPGSYKGYVITGKMELHGSGNSMILHRQTAQAAYMSWWDRRDGKNQRSGYIGHADGTSDAIVWNNDIGQNSVVLETSGQISFRTGETKIVYTNGQYYSANSDAYRMIFGNYGAFWRNDGTKVYLLSTAENDKFGGWNGYRPFIYDLTSGNVQLGGDGNEEALTLERASRAARFSNDVYIKKGHLTFDAGRLNSRDYFRFNHWGDSNNGRDNILYLEDSKGRHFSTERNMATGALKADFLGDLEVGGKLIWGKNTGQSSFNIRAWGNDSRKQVLECADESGWHWYTERTAGGTGPIKFSVAGSFHSASDVNVGGSLNFGNAIQRGASVITIASSSAGAGSFASQHDDNVKAPIFQRLDRGDASTYVPLIKQRYVQGAVTFSLGMLLNEGSWRVHVKGSGVESNTTFYKNGDFQAGRNGNFNDVYIRSDARLKINKEEYKENATDKVNRLTVYTYDKVKSLTDRTVIAHEVGIIAQDLEKELPEAVTTSNIGDPDKPEEILTISNSAVNALLIKAFQEMSEELKAVKAELAELKKN